MARQSILAILAAAFHLLLAWGAMSLGAKVDPLIGSTPLWYELLQAPFNGVIVVLPGLLLGYLVKRNGLLLGAVCGLLAGPVELWLVISHWGHWASTPEAFALLASGAFGTAVISGVAGGAGELLASKVGSNNSFKPKPLRGSA
jgi:hypothetical protein